MNSQKDNTDLLPNDMIEIIMLNSRYEEIIELSNINKNFKAISDNLWKKLIERDFPFMLKSKCKLKQSDKYNSYKKIYEIVYNIISRGIYDILNEYEREKKMKKRYPASTYDQLFNLITETISEKTIDYENVMEKIAYILSLKEYNVTALKFSLNSRIYNYINYFNCNKIQYIDQNKIYY